MCPFCLHFVSAFVTYFTLRRFAKSLPVSFSPKGDQTLLTIGLTLDFLLFRRDPLHPFATGEVPPSSRTRSGVPSSLEPGPRRVSLRGCHLVVNSPLPTLYPGLSTRFRPSASWRTSGSLLRPKRGSRHLWVYSPKIRFLSLRVSG